MAMARTRAMARKGAMARAAKAMAMATTVVGNKVGDSKGGKGNDNSNKEGNGNGIKEGNCDCNITVMVQAECLCRRGFGGEISERERILQDLGKSYLLFCFLDP